MSFVSYAQNGEDVMLHRVFGGQQTGFYVDVGAYDPVVGSVTKAFYDRGWSGINVEPGSAFVELAKARPRDINLRMVVLDHKGEVAFIEDETDRGMSRAVLDDDFQGSATMVPCDTLQAIVDAHSRGRPVDFIKIDAEGAETAIVLGTDWRRLRPHVLVLEATRPWSNLLVNGDWESALVQQGFIHAYFDGINCFYIPEEDAPALLRHFQVPVNVLDRVERYDTVMTREELQARQAEVAHLAEERDALRTVLNEKVTDAERLAAKLDDRKADAERLIAELQDRQAAAARMTTSFNAQRAELSRMTAERDTLRTSLDVQQAELSRLTAERNSLCTSLAVQQAEVARMTAELTALRKALDEKSGEASEMASGVRHLEAPGTTPVVAPSPRFPLVRRAAKAAYQVVRPAVRPPLWRLRTFMTSDLVRQIRHLDQRVEALAARPIVESPVTVQPTVVQVRDDGAAGEIRRLAAEMERTLLTLALEQAPEASRS